MLSEFVRLSQHPTIEGVVAEQLTALQLGMRYACSPGLLDL